MSDAVARKGPSESEEGNVIRCSQCHAPLTFDPKAGGLKCTYCGATVDLSGPGHIGAHPLEAGLEVRAKPHLSTKRPVVCGNCGATCLVEADHVSLQCIFCLSTLTPASDAAELAEVDGIVPFELDAADAKAAFDGWLKGVWFAPNALTRLSKIENMRATYVPLWWFSAKARSNWSGEIFAINQDGEPVGKVQRVLKGIHEGDYSKVLIGASSVLSEDPLDWVGLWASADHARPFNRGYLAGFDAELPGAQVGDVWPKALKRVHKDEADACVDLIQKQEGADETQRNMEITTVTVDEAYRLVLLPLYVIAYRFQDRVFRVLVNGRKGAVDGDHPWSWWKLGPFLTVVAAVLGYLAYLWFR